MLDSTTAAADPATGRPEITLPVLLAALGGALCARVGVFNIGLEGQMLLGCFTAVAVSAKTGSALLGVAFAFKLTTRFEPFVPPVNVPITVPP